MKRFRFFLPLFAAAAAVIAVAVGTFETVATAIERTASAACAWVRATAHTVVQAFKSDRLTAPLNAATGLVTAGAYRANILRREQPLHAPGGWRMCPSG